MTRSLARAGAIAVAAVLLGGVAAPGAVAGTHHRRVVFTIVAPEVDESSGLVVSTTEPHLVYTANDSGGTATVYALDSRTGELAGATDLIGVDPLDVEALAGGSDGSLVMADIGDNDADHSTVELYRFPQPRRGSAEVTADVVSLTYVDGPRDAEGALYDADTGRAFVISKEFGDAHVYATPRNVFDRGQAVLTPVATAPSIATDATFLPGQQFVCIRTYLTAIFYTFPGWKRVASVELPLQPQGETVAAPARGMEIWVGSEGVGSDVLAVDVPDLTFEEPTTSPTTSAPSTPSEPSADDSRDARKEAAGNVIVVAGALLVAVLVVVVIRYIRHRPE